MARANDQVAFALRELAELSVLDEGSAQAFRVRAYRKAADAVTALPTDVAGMSVSELEKVEGIGRSTAEKIRELVDTGRIEKLEVLRRRYPPQLVELLHVPGLGPKRVLELRDRLGVGSIDDLRRAIEEHRLRELPGFGAKLEERLGRAIELLGLHGEGRRIPIAEALPVAALVVEALADLPEVAEVAYAGSLRRLRETIGDVDVVAGAERPAAVMDAFVDLPEVREVLARGETKATVLVSGELQVDLRVVAPESYGAALLYFTGSKAHNIALRQRALERGWTLNEYALSVVDDGTVVAARTEGEIYRALDLAWIPPPMREDRGEIEAAAEGRLPAVPTVEDVRGDLHVHSDHSGDGRSPLEAMVEAASRRGYEYLAITEHAEGLVVNGLDRDGFLAEAEEIERLRTAHPGLTLLFGAELNIDPDGGLDFDDDFLAGFDWCVASVHSHFDLPEDRQTERVLSAMSHPAVSCIGHLTGRRIGRRPGISLDVDAVFDAAALHGCALEINGSLERLDVPADLLLRARDRDDLVFVVTTDAHHVSELAGMRYAVLAAQRGWVSRERIANTWPRERFLNWLRRRRGPNRV